MTQIILTSNLLGKIEARIEQTVEGTYAAVLVSAKILGETLLGCFYPQNNTVKFHSNQNFYTETAARLGANRKRFDNVSKQLRAKISDKKARFTLLTEFEVKISPENLEKVLELYRFAVSTRPVAKIIYTTRRHADGCECEDCEWNDDQNYFPAQPIDDANSDNIEETSRIGAN